MPAENALPPSDMIKPDHKPIPVRNLFHNFGKFFWLTFSCFSRPSETSVVLLWILKLYRLIQNTIPSSVSIKTRSHHALCNYGCCIFRRFTVVKRKDHTPKYSLQPMFRTHHLSFSFNSLIFHLLLQISEQLLPFHFLKDVPAPPGL